MTNTPPSPPKPAGRRRFARLAAPAALLLAGLAAGCGTPEDKFPPVCPGLSLVRDASRLTRFAGAGRDATDMVLHAEITAVPAKCEAADATHVRATLSVNADLTRGAAASADATVPVTYFLAITEGERVWQEQDFPLTVRFTSGRNRLTIAGDEIELLLPVSKKKSAAAYRLHVGFRLTPAELAYNRGHP
jgi:hypothetical protein